MLRQLARKVNKAVVFYAKELLLNMFMLRGYAPGLSAGLIVGRRHSSETRKNAS
jgi:hypothetical protein